MDDRVGNLGGQGGSGMVRPDAAAPAAVRDLTKIYGTITAVDHISFTLAQGTTVALLGGNGAGKTTTIAMLLGLVVPSSGEVRVFGADVSRNRSAVAYRMNFQSPYVDLPARLTVRQNLTVYAGLYGVANAADRIAFIAEDLQIKPLLDRPTGKLSAGQKTRVGLAKALLNAPDLLLLDEPTASLDPDTADWVRRKLKDYAETRGVDAAARVAQHGRGRAVGRPRHFASSRPHHRGRDARRIDRDLWTGIAGRGVSRRGSRPRQTCARTADTESIMSTAGTPAKGAEPILLAPVGLSASLRRIGALVRRYVYLLRSSGVRLVELIYWPFLQMLTWGFLQQYLAETTGPLAQAAGVLIGSVLLWDILFRSNIGFSTTFIEEMWSRNLGNLLISPLRPYELVAALIRLERDPPVGEHRSRRGRRLFLLRLQPARSRPAAGRILRRAGADQLVARLDRGGRHSALWARRRGARLVARLSAPAAVLRVLPGLGVAGLAAAGRAGAAAHPRVRRHALDPAASIPSTPRSCGGRSA